METTPRYSNIGLAALEAAVAQDLEMLRYPRRPWRPAPGAPQSAAFDVVIVGGGQGALATAAKLLREGVHNIICVDENPEGKEGPWDTFARMITLRTPKFILGPDLGIPCLTLQAWFEAQHGHTKWEQLQRLNKSDWMAYLKWFRRVLHIPVRNNTRVVDIRWSHEQNCFHLQTNGDPVLGSTVVLATGIDGNGGWVVPSVVTAKGLPKSFYAHTREAETLDFASMKGKKVAVLGAAASAFDNAATVLEFGGGEVHLFCRRSDLVKVNVHRWAENVGFLKHHTDLSDDLKWEFVNQYFEMGQLPPPDTYTRCTQRSNFSIHLGCPWTSVEPTEDGKMARVVTPKGTFDFDFLIIGTGFNTDLTQRAELKSIVQDIALWRDSYTPKKLNPSDTLLNHPYLGPNFQFTEKKKGAAPYLENIFDFTFGAMLSQGLSGSSISAMTFAVPRLCNGITKALYKKDVEYYLKSLVEYSEEELIVPCSVGAVAPQ